MKISNQDELAGVYVSVPEYSATAPERVRLDATTEMPAYLELKKATCKPDFVIGPRSITSPST